MQSVAVKEHSVAVKHNTTQHNTECGCERTERCFTGLKTLSKNTTNHWQIKHGGGWERTEQRQKQNKNDGKEEVNHDPQKPHVDRDMVFSHVKHTCKTHMTKNPK